MVECRGAAAARAQRCVAACHISVVNLADSEYVAGVDLPTGFSLCYKEPDASLTHFVGLCQGARQLRHSFFVLIMNQQFRLWEKISAAVHCSHVHQTQVVQG